MFYNILDKKRLEILPLFKNFKKDFYLAGETALSLQIGHRDSIDFDFFTERDFDTKKLFSKIKEVFENYNILKIQEEKNTLSVLINKSIKLSFFSYKYKLIDNLIDEKYLKLATIEDIGCMKISAILGRATNKDYLDIYFILQKISLNKLLEKSSKKFTDIDKNLILKSLVYFEDIDIEPIIFKNSKIDFEKVKKFLRKSVEEYLEE